MATRGKNYLIVIYLILKKYATVENPLSIKDIQRKITYELGEDQVLDPRTIKSHISNLQDISYEIDSLEECIETVDNRYYLLSPMDDTQIRLLADVIASTKYLGQIESRELIRQLYESNQRKMPRFYVNSLKHKEFNTKPNLETFLSVETISTAIEQKKKVSCTYLEYDVNQQLVPKKHNAERVLDVHEIIWTSNYYYALCIFEDSGKVYFLRIDKMRDVRIVNERVKPLPIDFDITNYVSTQPHLFGGQRQTISFQIEKRALGQVVDSFGKAAKITEVDCDYYKVELQSSIEMMHVWLIQYCDKVKNIYPERLNNMVISSLEKAVQNMKNPK